MLLPKAKDSLGSLRSQHKSFKNCSCKELEGRIIAPPPPPPAPPPLAASGRRNKRKGTASANSPISVPSAQHAVPSTSEENSPISVQKKKCDTALQFQTQEREIHQYLYHWTPCRLACKPCNYESKKMELCLQIQQIISIL